MIQCKIKITKPVTIKLIFSLMKINLWKFIFFIVIVNFLLTFFIRFDDVPKHFYELQCINYSTLNSADVEVLIFLSELKSIKISNLFLLSQFSPHPAYVTGTSHVILVPLSMHTECILFLFFHSFVSLFFCISHSVSESTTLWQWGRARIILVCS